MKEAGIYVMADITVHVKTELKLEEGETVAQFKERFADIYLHGAGEKGYLEKQDLGGDTQIKVGSITRVEIAEKTEA